MRRRSKLLRRSTYNKDYEVRAEMFSNNEQGLWLDPSDMTAGKAAWRRNLLTYSDVLSNAIWTKTASSVSTNVATSPDATSATADKIIEDGATLTHRVSQSLSLTSGVTYTWSFLAKADGRDVQVVTNSSFVSFGYANFNLATGEVGNQSAGISASVVDKGSGWYLCSVTFTSASTATGIIDIALITGPTAVRYETYAGNSTSGVIVDRIQFEVGSSCTDYQPITDFSTDFKAAYPTHTLYQDSTGVTPCTAAGDPVGLILDQSRGALSNLGPELIPDPTLTSTTGWVFDAGWSASSGTIVGDNAAAGSQIFANSPEILTQGRTYLVEVEITAHTGTSTRIDCRPFSGGTGSTNHASLSTVAIHRTVVVNTGANTRIAFRLPSNAAPGTVTITSVSVKEIPGNHAYQTTSASRPTLARIPSSGRRNLLTYSEEFDNAAWSKSSTTVTANSAVAPDNTQSADKLITNSATTGYINTSTFDMTNAHTFSIYAKASEHVGIRIGFDGLTAARAGAAFNLSNGTVSAVNDAPSVGTYIGSTITSVGNGWYRCSVSAINDSITTALIQACDASGVAVTGDGSSGVLLWGAQLETGSTATNYQKVVATTNVTESGVSDLWHLVFDGSDDGLVTNAVDFNTWTQETRRNLLLVTEDFANGTWIKTNLGVSGNTMTPDATLGQHRIYQQVTHTSPHVLSVEAKANGYNFISLAYAGGLNGQSIFFNLSDGTVSGSLANHTPAITDAGGGWYRCSLTYTGITASGAINHFVLIRNAASIADYSGDGVSGVLLRSPQLEQGSSLTDYQRVGTDEMTVIAGVRKLSDAARGTICELTATIASNNGAFHLTAPNAASATYAFESKGTSLTDAVASSVTAPITSVVSGASDISGDANVIRVNGTQSDSDTGDQGTANYSNAILYIGRRGGSSLPFNGHIYQLIVRGKTTPTGKLLEAERFVAGKTGVTGI